MIQTSFFPQPKKNKPIQIIQKIDTSILQPRKVEEVIPEANILPDTYIIYPEGGYHPFYGVKNSFPIYQLPIWPYIKRIKYSEWYSEKTLEEKKLRQRKINHPNSQLNFDIKNRYVCARLYTTISQQVTYYSKGPKKNGEFIKANAKKVFDINFHRLVAYTWIPNPKKKKYVCHINHDSTNYLIKNLVWGTPSENNKGNPYRSPDTLEQKYLSLVYRGVIKG